MAAWKPRLRVKRTRPALLDLDAVEAYIARDDPLSAAEVVVRVVRAVSLLKEHPGLGRTGRVPGTKEFVVPNSPFIIPYRVKDDTVQILRVYHASHKWPDRM